MPVQEMQYQFFSLESLLVTDIADYDIPQPLEGEKHRETEPPYQSEGGARGVTLGSSLSPIQGDIFSGI